MLIVVAVGVAIIVLAFVVDVLPGLLKQFGPAKEAVCAWACREPEEALLVEEMI